MTIPGVGPVVALTYRATVDVPAPIPKIQVGRGSVWADELQVSNRRDRLERQRIALRDEMMRVGLYRPVHVKTLRSQKLRMDDDLLAQYSPDGEHRLNQYRQIGKILDKFMDAGLELHLPNHADLEAEVAQSTA